MDAKDALIQIGSGGQKQNPEKVRAMSSVDYTHKTREFKVRHRFFGGVDVDSSTMSRDLDMEARDGWELVSMCPVTSWNYGRTEFLLAVFRKSTQRLLS